MASFKEKQREDEIQVNLSDACIIRRDILFLSSTQYEAKKNPDHHCHFWQMLQGQKVRCVGLHYHNFNLEVVFINPITL